MGVLFVIGLCFLTWLYVISQKNIIYRLYDAQIRQVDRTAVATNQLYKYVTVAPNTPLVLVQPKYQSELERGLWALVNKETPISLSYSPSKLVSIPIPKFQNDTNITVREELVEPLKAIYAAALQDGIKLMVRSGYRSSTQQQALISNAISATEAAYIAEAGQSEHQMGIAVDFNNSPVDCQTCGLDAASAKWLAANGPKYGFILRYPSDKVSITGYPAESWHYRYVGKDLALAMQKANLVFEEVYPLFEAAKPRGAQ